MFDCPALNGSPHVTPLSPVQLRILEILGFSSELYTRLEAVSVEPP
jgi:hypothetical protein